MGIFFPMALFGISFFLSFLVVWVTVPFLIAFSHKFAFGLALPGKRKVHAKPVPQIGGIAFLFALSCVAFFFRQELPPFLLGSVLFISFSGFWDDVKELHPFFRLAVQTGVAFFLFKIGVRIDYVSHPVAGVIPLGKLALPLTLAWIVGTTNAMNFIDGLDGLAAGLSFIASITFFLLSFHFAAPLPEVKILTGALAGMSLSFLRYNFFPARIFMGDGGAYLLGFLLAFLSIIGPFKSIFFFMLLAPFLAMGLPLLDMATAVFRRLLRGQSPALADRGHLHHRLLDKGFTPKQAVLFMYLLACLFAMVALYFTKAL